MCAEGEGKHEKRLFDYYYYYLSFYDFTFNKSFLNIKLTSEAKANEILEIILEHVQKIPNLELRTI